MELNNMSLKIFTVTHTPSVLPEIPTQYVHTQQDIY